MKSVEEILKDLYTIRSEEESQYSKIDEETGELKKEVPKLFTRTNKDVKQLSTDLNKVGVLWIKALTEYQSNKDLENTLLVLHSVEKAKGSIITDASNKPIFEAGGIVELIFARMSSRESRGETSIVDKYSPSYRMQEAFIYVAQLGQISAVLIKIQI